MISIEHYAETYTVEAVSELCQMAGIDPTDIGYVRIELEHFAAIYRWQHSKTSGFIGHADPDGWAVAGPHPDPDHHALRTSGR